MASRGQRHPWAQARGKDLSCCRPWSNDKAQTHPTREHPLTACGKCVAANHLAGRITYPPEHLPSPSQALADFSKDKCPHGHRVKMAGKQEIFFGKLWRGRHQSWAAESFSRPFVCKTIPERCRKLTNLGVISNPDICLIDKRKRNLSRKCPPMKDTM